MVFSFTSPYFALLLTCSAMAGAKKEEEMDPHTLLQLQGGAAGAQINENADVVEAYLDDDEDVIEDKQSESSSANSSRLHRDGESGLMSDSRNRSDDGQSSSYFGNMGSSTLDGVGRSGPGYDSGSPGQDSSGGQGGGLRSRKRGSALRSSVGMGSVIGTESAGGGAGGAQQGEDHYSPEMQAAYNKIIRLPSFKTACAALECAVVQTRLHEKHLLYRDTIKTALFPSSFTLPGGSASSATAVPNNNKEDAGGVEGDVNTPPSPQLVRASSEGSVAPNPDVNGNDANGNDAQNGEVAPGGDSDSIGVGGKYGNIGAEATGPLAGLSPADNLTERACMAQNEPEKSLTPLWSFACPLTEGRNVSCFDWNRANSDLLVAGYGSFTFGQHLNGLILFWSIKNPFYPVKIIKTQYGVSSLDFCTEHPHFLVAGFLNGGVALYDIRDSGDSPALESSHATGKHGGPVWGVKWVQKEQNERAQKLVSISSDGTVQQWSTKKGLIPHELMELKRTINKAQFQGSHMDGVSKDAAGLCFDFPTTDGSQYLAGTEEGVIHKCSVSYNEQMLESFHGHTGPVYKVRCSPYLSDAFLSCSADWSCMLWSHKLTSPIIKLHSGSSYIADVQWSPHNSCVFVCVSHDGRIQVWDLESSPLDPVIQYQAYEAPQWMDTSKDKKGDEGGDAEGSDPLLPTSSISNRFGSDIDKEEKPVPSGKMEQMPKQFTCVMFAPGQPVLVAGDASGSIGVYRVNGVSCSPDVWTPQEQVLRLVSLLPLCHSCFLLFLGPPVL